MAKIIIPPDCGNAPRKLFLKNLHIAFANGDLDFVTTNIPEEISWETIGKKTVMGRKSYLTALKDSKHWKVKELRVDAIITHGPDASVSGQITVSDGSVFDFCDVYRFARASGMAIGSIKTFLIKE